ncbi:MAG: hypothetical protein ACLP1X_33720 [Polyangiaceae bacterium]
MAVKHWVEIAAIGWLGWLGAIGSLVSIGSGILAWSQARKAIDARRAAEAARNELLQRRATIAIAELYAMGRSAADIARSLTNARIVRGRNRGEMLGKVQEFVDAMTQQAHNLPNAEQGEIGGVLTELRDQLGHIQGGPPAGDARRLNELVSRAVGILRRVLDRAPVD